jgi:hypothetical protein
MKTGQSIRHWSSGMRSEFLQRRIGRSALILLSALTLLLLTHPDAVAQNDPGVSEAWLKKFGGVLSKKVAAQSGCVADTSIGETWLDDSGHKKDKGVTQSYRKQTEDLLLNWEAKVSLDRFLLPGATESEQKLERLRVQVIFASHIEKLLELARDVAIANKQECQDCILLNDWSYLAYISTSAISWNLPQQQIATLTHPDKPDRTTRLNSATAASMKDVRTQIQRFKFISEKYAAAIDDEKYVQGLAKVCPDKDSTGELLAETDIGLKTQCLAKLSARCKQADFAESKQYCLKDHISQELKVTLAKIVDGLLGPAKTVDARPMMKLAQGKDGCKPTGAGGYFSWLNYIGVASMTP